MKKLFVLIALACLLSTVVTPAIAVECSGVCGDVNNDGSVNISDMVYLYNYIWMGGPPPPCMDQADANGDCHVNISDYLYLYNYIWMGGPAPVCGCDI